MNKHYASMPDWLYNWLGITEQQDSTAFRQHDHDYAGKSLVVKVDAVNQQLFFISTTRREADHWLCSRLIVYGMKRWKTRLIWVGVRIFCVGKWHKVGSKK